jgi:hypothetical protein
MQTKLVSDSPDALLSLIEAVKLCYHPPPEISIGRGRKPDFSDLSFLLLAVVAVATKTFSDSELHRLLERDTELRTALEFSRVPHRAPHFAPLEVTAGGCRRASFAFWQDHFGRSFARRNSIC